ncbi:MAG: L-fucose:H+ symporter permease [Bacteroidales bacterium]|nr:L-fucose:H+ symporter permease [Bacteroidales bacterium]MBO7380000.1 L-fucose:H+ symporter permease [Bacteroidales bacterium]
MKANESRTILHHNGVSYVVPFVLITSLFALWGFANDITNPMVAAFQTVMELSARKASMVQFAFYGGYATMAIPAALFIRKYSYKSGVLLGLGLYAVGAFLFIPAASLQNFTFFCFSLYILTFGLAFLETTANPYILSLGSKESSTRRLNMAQAFNPMGSLCGMAVASQLVLPNLWSDRRDEFGNIVYYTLSESEKADIRLHDLAVIRDPYVCIGVVVLVVLIVIALAKMPDTAGTHEKVSAGTTLKALWHNSVYREGVLAQVFYVAAQIMVWTFIIQYAERLGMSKATAQGYNIVAMCFFLSARFIATFLMRYFNGRLLLMWFGIGAACASAGTILIDGMLGLYCLIGISFFMSLMFPTIYGIALENVSAKDSTLGAAFLVMAIVGGSIFPPLQGSIIDAGGPEHIIMGLPSVNFSYVLPLVCFFFITLYGWRSYRKL